MKDINITDICAAKIKNGSTIITVTTTKYYEVPKGYFSGKIPDLMVEWFQKYLPLMSHAFRDGSLFYEKFNDDAEVVKHEEIYIGAHL